MASIIEYKTFTDIFSKPNLELIGYIDIEPEQALRKLFPNYHIVDYLGISIPSKSRYTNNNDGLRISPIQSGKGLEGNIQILEDDELFQRTKIHTPTNEYRKEVYDRIIQNLGLHEFSGEPMKNDKAKKYALIFEILGSPMSIEEIVKITTPKDYYEPIPNGGLIDVRKFYILD